MQFHFTEEEARAKIGKQVLVENDELSNMGIPLGTHGRVLDAFSLPGTVETGVGTTHAGGGKKSEGWLVEVEFYPPHNKRVKVRLDKNEYRHLTELENA